jgi:hypothetical protein
LFTVNETLGRDGLPFYLGLPLFLFWDFGADR